MLGVCAANLTDLNKQPKDKSQKIMKIKKTYMCLWSSGDDKIVWFDNENLKTKYVFFNVAVDSCELNWNYMSQIY